MRKFSAVGVLSFVVLLAAARSARAADELPAGVAKQDNATTGKNEVAKEGFGSAKKDDPKEKDATELAFTAGGLFSAGNSRSLAVTARIDHRL
ncbi:MAG: hypothetical protein JWM74_45, partial [Myxococcaceae bacterium]|nr:hypothetical protein [Myxococcaceae bacterium]